MSTYYQFKVFIFQRWHLTQEVTGSNPNPVIIEGIFFSEFIILSLTITVQNAFFLSIQKKYEDNNDFINTDFVLVIYQFKPYPVTEMYRLVAVQTA